MKVRGSLKISKDLTLLNPGQTLPEEGLVALSDALGKVRWGHVMILPLDLFYTYPDKGTLVSHEGKVYYSLVKRAKGRSFENTYVWRQVGLDTDKNNVVRTLTVQVSDLNGIGTIKEQLCAYVLGLPSLERTIGSSDSKWNILFDDNAYEITNKGIGELIELEPSNLLSIGTDGLRRDLMTLELVGDVAGQIKYEQGILVIETVSQKQESADVTDYNYNITGDRTELTPFMYLRKVYIPGTLKVYLNGMRLTRGNYYDYREGTGNILVMNYPLEEEDLLTADYKTNDLT